MNLFESNDYPCHGNVCIDCGKKINGSDSFLRWHEMYFCNRSCVIAYLMDKARECTECKTIIRPDLLGNRTRRNGNGNGISYFCSIDCITHNNRNLINDLYTTIGDCDLNSGSFDNIWNDIFKNGE